MLVQFVRISLILLIVGISSTLGCAQKKVEVYSYSGDRNRGWLGVEVQDVTSKLKKKKNLSVQNGAYVTNVIEDSPAEKAGIQDGDVIVKFDGKDINDADNLIRAVRKTKPKTDVTVELVRKNDKKSLTVTLGKVPRSKDYSYFFPIPRLKPHPFKFHFFSESEIYGLRVQTLNKQLAEYFDVPDKKGVLITEVKKNSAASKAGFQAGDVIVNVDKERVEDTDVLMEILCEKDSEGETEFEVIRKGKSTILKMKLEDEDANDYSSFRTLPYFEHVERIPFHRNFDIHLDRLHDKLEMLKHKIMRDTEKLQRRIKSDIEKVQIKT